MRVQNQTGELQKSLRSFYLSARYIEPNLFLDESSKKEKANGFVQLLAFFNAVSAHFIISFHLMGP